MVSERVWSLKKQDSWKMLENKWLTLISFKRNKSFCVLVSIVEHVTRDVAKEK